MTGSVVVLAGAGLRGRRRSGLAATFVVLTMAAIGIAAGLTVSRQGAPLLDEAADEANVAHLVLFGDAAAVASAAAGPEVAAWSGPFVTRGGLDLLVEGGEVPARLTALDDPDIPVNRPASLAGRWMASDDEIVLDRSVASDLGIEVGDETSFGLDGTITSFEVVGTAVDLTDCFYPQCEPARAWTTSGGLDRLGGGADATTAQGWMRFDDAARADPFVERLAAEGVTDIEGSESWLDTRSDFLTLDRVFGSFVAAFGLFVLAVAAVVVAGSTTMRIVARRREIGLLGAVGCTPGQITTGLLLENLTVGVAAGTMGWFLGGLLAPSLQLGIGRTLGPQDPSWTAIGLVVSISAISAILAAATIAPAWSAARRPVTDVLRDVPTHQVSGITRRVARLPSRLPLLGVQEALSQPTRAALSSLAIVVAVVGAVVSVGFIGAVAAVGDDPATAGTPWDVALLPGEVPATDVEAALLEVPGIERWYSEVPRRSTLDGGTFLSVATSGDPAAAGFQIAEGRTPQRAGEAIAGYGFLERFGLAVGDEVRLLAGTTPITVEIVGWYRVTEDSGEVLRYGLTDLAIAEPDVEPDIYRISAVPGEDPGALAATIGARLGPGVGTEILDTGVADLAPLLVVLRLIAAVLLVMAGTNLLSTLLTSNREAAGRIGVQLAVGFTPRQVTEQGAVTGASLGAVAILVGIPLGLWLFRTLSDVVSSSLGVGPGWMPAPAIASIAALGVATMVMSTALGGLATSRVARRSVSDLVRGE